MKLFLFSLLFVFAIVVAALPPEKKDGKLTVDNVVPGLISSNGTWGAFCANAGHDGREQFMQSAATKKYLVYYFPSNAWVTAGKPSQAQIKFRAEMVKLLNGVSSGVTPTNCPLTAESVTRLRDSLNLLSHVEIKLELTDDATTVLKTVGWPWLAPSNGTPTNVVTP